MLPIFSPHHIELARQIGTHPSTLVRFSQHFGFSGFSELQRLYRDHLRSNTVGYSSRLEGIDDVGAADVLWAITQSAVQSATDLEASLDLSAWWPPNVRPDIALTAVLDRGDNGLNHWAISHPSDRADFHQRQTFLSN